MQGFALGREVELCIAADQPFGLELSEQLAGRKASP
jgi:hypothetical protein